METKSQFIAQTLQTCSEIDYMELAKFRYVSSVFGVLSVSEVTVAYVSNKKSIETVMGQTVLWSIYTTCCLKSFVCA